MMSDFRSDFEEAFRRYSGEGLPEDELISLRHQEAIALRSYNAACRAWVVACRGKRWWQRKPPEPRIGDYLP